MFYNQSMHFFLVFYIAFLSLAVSGSCTGLHQRKTIMREMQMTMITLNLKCHRYEKHKEMNQL